MKKILAFIFCVLIVFTVPLNTFAQINCDGWANAYEWNGVESNLLFKKGDHSGCDFITASARVKFEEESRRVYLALGLEGNGVANESELNHIYVIFNDSSEIILYSDGEAEYDKNDFDVEFGYVADNYGGGTYEADFALKSIDYSDTLVMTLKIADCNGDVSQEYRLTVKSEELIEKESVFEEESKKEAEKEQSKKERTTKVKTTKTKTTKAKTTKIETEYITAVITEEYKSYAENQSKNSRAVLFIGIACVVTTIAAMCVSLKSKNK